MIEWLPLVLGGMMYFAALALWLRGMALVLEWMVTA